MIRIHFLSIIVGILLILVNNTHDVGWGDSFSSFCYDEVGDDQFCFNIEADCSVAQNSNQIAESHCYKEE